MGIFKTLTVGGTTFELAPAISEHGGLEFDSERKLRVKTYSDSSLKLGDAGLYLDLKNSYTIKDTPQGLEVKFNAQRMKSGSDGLDIHYNDYLFKDNLQMLCNGSYAIDGGYVLPPSPYISTPLGLAAFSSNNGNCLGVALWGNTNRPMVRDYLFGISNVAPLAFVYDPSGSAYSIGVPIYGVIYSSEDGLNPIQVGPNGLYIDCFYMAKCVAGLLRTSDNKTLTAKFFNE